MTIHNAIKIELNGRLSKDIQKGIKRRFNAFWNEVNFYWTVSNEHKITIESYLKKECVEFSLIDIYEWFYSLNKSEQRIELLRQAQQRAITRGLVSMNTLKESIHDYNTSWGTNLEIKDFIGKSIEAFRDLANSEEPKQIKHLDILFKMHTYFDRERNNHISISNKIINHQTNKEFVELPQNSFPTIKIFPGLLHDAIDLAEKILSSNSLNIFQRGGQLVRIITEVSRPKKNKLLDKDGKEIIKRSADALLIAAVDPIYLTEFLGQHANWLKYDSRKGDWVRKDCPERIAKTLIARREWNIPVLTGIIQSPTLRSDGSILDKPGYDEITGLFFHAGDTVFQSIPSHPSREDALLALEILFQPLIDFSFENEVSKSVAVSAILTGLVRKSIRTAPLHGYTAPKMGSGKSLLADVVGLIATGKSNSVIPQAENEAEEKKRLLAILSEGDSIICYDNIEHPFGSPALCSVLTQEEFKDRLLGLNRSLNVLTNATFLATGNNLTFIGDTSTRAILCRLDPQCERPEERSFSIDLRQYIPLHRSELVQAALIILRAYHVAGRPKQNIPQFGRFEDWSDWIRSSLVWLEMVDPCTSRQDIENADPIRLALGSLLSSWYKAFNVSSLKAKDAIRKAEEPHNLELFEALKEVAPNNCGGICSIKLGKCLSAFNKRIEGGYRVEKMPKHQNADTWRVVKI